MRQQGSDVNILQCVGDIFADIKITLLMSLIMVMFTSEGGCRNMLDGCLILGLVI